MLLTYSRAPHLARFAYVSAKKIAEVYDKNNTGYPLSFIMASIKATGFKMSEGFKQAKADCKFFYNTWGQKEQHSKEVLRKRYRIAGDLFKLPVVGTLFMLPLGIPIIMLYMHYFPALNPTWFSTDLQYQKQLQLKQIKQREALNFFLNCGSITISEQPSTTINYQVYEKMSYTEKKKISELLFGEARDGTNLIYLSFGVKFDCFLSEDLSEWVIKKDLQQKISFQDDLEHIEGIDDLQKMIKRIVSHLTTKKICQ